MNSRKNLLIAFLLLVAAAISPSLLAQQKTVHIKVVSDGKNTDSVYTVNYHTGSEGVKHQKFVTVYHNKVKGSDSNGDSIIEIRVNAGDNEREENDGAGNIVMVRHARGVHHAEEINEESEEFPVSFSTSYSSSSSNSSDADSSLHRSIRKKIVMYVNDDGNVAPRHHRMRHSMPNGAGAAGDIEAQMDKIPLSIKDTTITHISPQGDTIKIHRKVLKEGEIEQEVRINNHSNDSADTKFFTYRAHAGKNRMYFRNMDPRGRGDETMEEMMPPMTPDGDLGFESMDMPAGIDENTDFGKIKVTPLMGKNMVRISLDLSGKETTVISIKDEKGKSIFEEKIKDLTGKYVRDIDMTGNANGKYNLGIERGKSSLTKSFSY